MQPIVHLAGASFRRNSRPIFENVDLQLGKGEIVCLLGPNGCGKTTLLQCIAGLLELESGVVHLAGDDTAHLSARQIAQRIGFVFQDHQGLYPLSRPRRRGDGSNPPPWLARPPGPRRPADLRGRARQDRHVPRRRHSLHPAERGRASAGADREGDRAGDLGPPARRAHRSPGLRQPGHGARHDAPARGRGARHAGRHALAGPGARRRNEDRHDARRRIGRRRASRSGHDRREPPAPVRRGGPHHRRARRRRRRHQDGRAGPRPATPQPEQEPPLGAQSRLGPEYGKP